MSKMKYPALTAAQYDDLIAYYDALQQSMMAHAKHAAERGRISRMADLRARALYYRHAACWLRGEVGRLRQRRAHMPTAKVARPKRDHHSTPISGSATIRGRGA